MCVHSSRSRVSKNKPIDPFSHPLSKTRPMPATNKNLSQVAVSSPPRLVTLEQLRDRSPLQAMPGKWDSCLNRYAASRWLPEEAPAEERKAPRKWTIGPSNLGPAWSPLSGQMPFPLLLRTATAGVLGAQRGDSADTSQGLLGAPGQTSLKLVNLPPPPKGHHTWSCLCDPSVASVGHIKKGHLHELLACLPF